MGSSWNEKAVRRSKIGDPGGGSKSRRNKVEPASQQMWGRHSGSRALWEEVGEKAAPEKKGPTNMLHQIKKERRNRLGRDARSENSYNGEP